MQDIWIAGVAGLIGKTSVHPFYRGKIYNSTGESTPFSFDRIKRCAQEEGILTLWDNNAGLKRFAVSQALNFSIYGFFKRTIFNNTNNNNFSNFIAGGLAGVLSFNTISLFDKLLKVNTKYYSLSTKYSIASSYFFFNHGLYFGLYEIMKQKLNIENSFFPSILIAWGTTTTANILTHPIYVSMGTFNSWFGERIFFSIEKKFCWKITFII